MTLNEELPQPPTMPSFFNRKQPELSPAAHAVSKILHNRLRMEESDSGSCIVLRGIDKAVEDITKLILETHTEWAIGTSEGYLPCSEETAKSLANTSGATLVKREVTQWAAIPQEVVHVYAATVRVRDGDLGTWSHCGDKKKHSSHRHTPVFGEGATLPTLCNGT